MQNNPRSLYTTILGFLMWLPGALLFAGGAWLMVLGGSIYYAVAGLLLALTGSLVHRRAPSAVWAFAVLFAGSLAWAVWESGLDWWPLAARMGVLFMLGVLMLLPWTLRRLDGGRVQPPIEAPITPPGTPPTGGQPEPVRPSRFELFTRNHRAHRAPRAASWRRGGGMALSLAMACFALLSAVTWIRDVHALEGALPPSQGALVDQGSAVRGVPPGEWHAYGRTGFGQRYSPLADITPSNVADLQVVWHAHTGDLRGQPGDPEETTFQATPLKIGNRLYLCTPHQTVMALDATTGQEIWRHDAKVSRNLALQHLTCRGLSYQPPAAAPAPAGTAETAETDAAAAAAGVADAPASASADAPAAAAAPASPATPASPAPDATAAACPNGKLFMPTADGRLLALDPERGGPCTAFGGGKGEIDLWQHMPNHRPGAYYSTSPVVVTARLVIVGGTVLDNVSTAEQSGVIRAFDIETGALVWNWDSGNPDTTTPIAEGARYTVNSPNSWSISSVDEALGMVYVPMGNQPPDQWGGNRSAAVEKYSSSVVALDLATGQVRWVFQTVHHDLWDYDVPAQPSLVDLNIDGATVPALVQPTKQGELFVLDRRTGVPIRPQADTPAPQGAAQGDRTAATQPRAAISFDPPMLRERSMWGVTMFDQLACRIAFKRLRYEGRFTPPSTQGSLIHPGNFGVFNWGGVAVDPRRQIAFTTPTYLPFVSTLVPRPDDTALMVQKDGPPAGALPALNENFGAPFAVKLGPFLSPLGVPCVAPPWGYVAGADLTSGKIVWQHRNGTVRDLSPIPVPIRMGVPNLGGPIVTAGGVAFLSGSLDNYVRAYDVTSGKQLWESRLPAGGQATPMTYTADDGRQFVLVVAGGHGSLGTTPGDSVIAYALPKR
ncbi:membrane-bound PQQ-dependent dehydrogenase, glucose/quinate/shikimate family [Pseudorhodoferax sp. Leaf274]|uniref:membrane-bound PQQ-dependent dehydrogenase, glucose/quinate/shikimate family n=1 Tax=Pseudorhodoferax sp. Leaf274 TaxID=1736318 RepID=UPI000702829C|nr:membrane-bound PQQ-dependent dehydrogenase, glucose/quinate/shikimate family [Pseudorhodoferax sp. Leaf274]KQP44612.1 glucose dehydrogenase [Pseudorhodoferax sp. Leaf274]